MTEPTGRPTGRPPALTPEQDREIFERYEAWRRNLPKRIRNEYGVTKNAVARAVARERARRRA